MQITIASSSYWLDTIPNAKSIFHFGILTTSYQNKNWWTLTGPTIFKCSFLSFDFLQLRSTSEEATYNFKKNCSTYVKSKWYLVWRNVAPAPLGMRPSKASGSNCSILISSAICKKTTLSLFIIQSIATKLV